MSTTEDSFFEEKRAWSKIKDDILAKYLRPYLQAVTKLDPPVIIVDGYAGPGTFGEEHIDGSPLIISKAIEKFGGNKTQGIFVNRELDDHQSLCQAIRPYSDAGMVRAHRSDAHDFLQQFVRGLSNETVLYYLDPFGMKGLDMELIRALLNRPPSISTELLVNLYVPQLHRYGIEENDGNPEFQWRHELLSSVFGGTYWKAILWNGLLLNEAKEDAIIEEYKRRLRQLSRYVVSCSVREREDKVRKFELMHCSRSPLALELMNDIMAGAYNDYMHSVVLQDLPLFAATMRSWRDSRQDERSSIKEVILEVTRLRPGIPKQTLWRKIVEDHFKQFLSSDFNQALLELLDSNLIRSPDLKHSKGISKTCRLYLT